VDQLAQETDGEARASQSVFVSYATDNRTKALKVCEALERHGVRCWISCRDVPPGQNYQEAIVRALRDARAVVLVFSGAANTSDEIKKELSLASRYHVPVMALRIEDVEPSDAFAYELSTRQWVDAFTGWDRAIQRLVSEIANAGPTPGSNQAKIEPTRAPRLGSRQVAVAAILVLTMIFAGFTWRFLRSSNPAPHSMTVRLAGFSRLSADLPSTMPAAMSDEIIAAFANDGTIGVSTASSPLPGDAPAYALNGTVRREGDKIKVIAHLINERSSADLWSESVDFDAKQLDKVPRKVAVIAGNMVRCGLFAASTYPKPLPDSVMADYLRYCHDSGQVTTEPTRALDFAHKVVAALPDFSMGWSAISNATTLENGATDAEANDRHAAGLDAAEKALQLDPRNGEALGNKSLLIDPADLIGREQLLQRAIAARPQSCGCERNLYGVLLEQVGRFKDASEQLRRATELNPLDSNLQWGFADALSITGREPEAKIHYDSVVDLSNDSDMSKNVILSSGLVTGNFREMLPIFRDPNVGLPNGQRVAFITGLEALQSHDATARAQAIRLLSSTDLTGFQNLASNLLAALGANAEALKMVSDAADAHTWGARSWLFYPRMRGALTDPSFPALAGKLGLMKYWKVTRTKPDVCLKSEAPPFCQMI